MKIKVPNKSPQRIDENGVAVKRYSMYLAYGLSREWRPFGTHKRMHSHVCASKQHIWNGIKLVYVNETVEQLNTYTHNSLSILVRVILLLYFICLIPLRIHYGNSISHTHTTNIREWKRKTCGSKDRIWKFIGFNWELNIVAALIEPHRVCVCECEKCFGSMA